MFMTGFYSKDFILESAYGQYYFSSTVVYIIATIGAMFTTLYSVKVLYLTFLTNPNGPLINYKQAHEGDIFMSLPLIILAVFSIFFGFITKDMFIGLGSGFFADNALFIHPCHEIMLDTEFGVPTIFKLLPLIFTISLSVISIVLSTVLIYFKLSRIGYNIFSFFNQRFLIELFYNKFITGIILKLGGQTTKVIDKGSIEYIGPHGLEKGLLNISNNIAKLNTGIITSYALYILVGLIFYILFNAYIHYSITMLILCISLVFTLHSNNQLSIMPSTLQFSTTHRNVELSSDSTPLFVTKPLQSSIDISEIVAEINTLMPQLANFMNQFNTTISQSGVNVVTDSMGSMSIDVPHNMPDDVANKISTKLGIIDRLITTRGQEINDLLQKGVHLENKLKMENSNYVSQLTDKIEEFRKLNSAYKH
jgi:NADH-ubiquinone oxidoreductase chain 5